MIGAVEDDKRTLKLLQMSDDLIERSERSERKGIELSKRNENLLRRCLKVTNRAKETANRKIDLNYR